MAAAKSSGRKFTTTEKWRVICGGEFAYAWGHTRAGKIVLVMALAFLVSMTAHASADEPEPHPSGLNAGTRVTEAFSVGLAALLNEFPDIRTLDVVSIAASTPRGSVPAHASCRFVIVHQRGRADELCNFGSDAEQVWCGKPSKEHVTAFESPDEPCGQLAEAMKDKPIMRRQVENVAPLQRLGRLLDEVTSVRVISLEARSGLRAVEVQGSRAQKNIHSLVIHDGTSWAESTHLPFSDEVATHPYLDAGALYATPSWGFVFVKSETGHGNNGSGGDSYSLRFFSKRADGIVPVATRPLGTDVWWRAVTGEGLRMGGLSAVLCPGVAGTRLELWLACQVYADPRAAMYQGYEPFGERCRRAQSGQCRPSRLPLASNPLIKRQSGSYAARGGTFVPWGMRDRVMLLTDLRAAIVKDNEHAWQTENETGRAVTPAPRLIVSERPYEVETNATVEWLELQNLMKVPLDLASLKLKDSNGHSGVIIGACTVPPGDVAILRRGDGPSLSADAIECFFGDAKLQGHVKLLADDVEIGDSWPTDKDASLHSRQLDAKGKQCLRLQSPGQVNRPCQ